MIRIITLVLIGVILLILFIFYNRRNENKNKLEIERKFATDKLPFALEFFDYIDIEQKYFEGREGVMRIRKETFLCRKLFKSDYLVMIKLGEGLVRRENINFINRFTYRRLLNLDDNKPIRKRRYILRSDEEMEMTVDVFEDENWNDKYKYLIEIEFSSKELAESFKKYDWLGEEVTYNSNFKNKNIFQKINKEE